MSSQIKDVIIIGGGASGLMAAISAAGAGAADVLILEQQDKPGRKLLMTGNGRCNLTHLKPDTESVYHSSDPDALLEVMDHIFSHCGVEETLAAFEQMGLWCHDRNGYVYPRSDQASSVLHVLLSSCEQLGIKMKYRICVTGLEEIESEGEHCWHVMTDGWVYSARCVIVAGGSHAGLPRQTAKKNDNSRSSGEACSMLLQAARALGHTIIHPVPSLTGLCISSPDLAEAAGARTDAAVTLLEQTRPGRDLSRLTETDLKEIAVQTGQVQWNKDGLSGICVMQLSAHVAVRMRGRRDHTGTFRNGLAPHRKKDGAKQISAEDSPALYIRLDFIPDLSASDISAGLLQQAERRHLPACDRWTAHDIAGVLTGFVPDRIARLTAGKFLSLPRSERSLPQLTNLLKGMLLPVDGTRDFEQAQVMAGGIALSDVHSDTLESRWRPHLYFAGEILDIDGDCGGYNLQWAWSSGMAAGKAAGIFCHSLHTAKQSMVHNPV